jgi:hypothetical protein
MHGRGLSVPDEFSRTRVDEPGGFVVACCLGR